MAFDGVTRPSQLTPADPLNPYLAAHSAKADEVKKPQVKKSQKDEETTGVHKELPQYGEEEEENQQALTEEEAEQIMKFAKMRGLMNVALQDGVEYQFQINADEGLVDLIEAKSGKVVMTLTPSELMEMTDKIQRYAGVLTDRAG